MSDDPPEARALQPFIGRWITDGRSRPAPGDASAPPASEPLSVRMHGSHTYEWLPGGFVLHRWDEQVGGATFRGAWIMGWDRAAGGYAVHLFADTGDALRYAATVDGDTWTLTGDRQRATLEIARDGASMRHRWWQREGDAWVPLCDLQVRRDAAG